MKFCEKCGKEILDEAVICPNCGCEATESASATAPKKEELKKKINPLLIAIPAAVVVIAILAVLFFRFWNKPKTEITLDDLTEPISSTSALFKYGAPDNGDGSKYYGYYDRITLEDIELKRFSVEFAENNIELFGNYYISMDYEDSGEFVEMLTEKAELVGHNEYPSYVEGVNDNDHIFKFEYEDLEIVMNLTHLADDSISCTFEFICD